MDTQGYSCANYTDVCEDGLPLREKAGFLATAFYGESALDACCICGGGCSDAVGWVDSDGFKCQEYAGWCVDGHALKPERDYRKFAVKNVSALEACCRCGGSRRKANWCEDLAGWTDAEGNGCGRYESLLSFDQKMCEAGKPIGAVNAITDLGAIGKDGVNRSALDACCVCGGGKPTEFKPSVKPAGCVDLSWADREGGSCGDYEPQVVAMRSGTRRPSCVNRAPSDSSSEAFLSYAVNNVSALDACCNCGGGKQADETDVACRDMPRWKDKRGGTCLNYTDVCQAGRKVAEEVDLAASADASGFSAEDACCVCGGGLDHQAGPAACTDDEAFADSEGFKCADYYDLCLDGRPLHPEVMYLNYKNDKFRSALDACCRCGGGSK